ncbi:hypothetical protein TrVFT333_007878 [Trichoderma virens FT-333]|nr:hypothetical protein TrVFT333_007878 [Trichoderma virens FT-333]
MPRHQDDEEVDPLHTVGVSRNSEETNYSQASNPPRQSAVPLVAGNRVSGNRYPALEMWQMDAVADKRERAASIPSRAWIPFMDSLGGQGDGDGSDTSESDTLASTSPTDYGDETETHLHSMRNMASRTQRSRQKSVVLGEFGKCTGRAQPDGRMSITVHDTAHTGYIANAVGAVKYSMQSRRKMTAADARENAPKLAQIPQKLNIVIMVVGSRGDVQPFLQIGKQLKEDYHHRVRIATHPIFRDIVESQAGLEFFSVGGDPSELMEFMVKNPGLIPTFRTVKAGEIGKRRAAMATMLDGFWRACIHATEDDCTSLQANASAPNAFADKDIFIADAIISNPPSFAHIHCAEALGIPLHLVFTFPYTPTRAFPHPLANIKGNTENAKDGGYANFMSYPLIETMTWQGLGDLINDFRVRTLALDAVSTFWAPYAIYRMHVPFTYLWSPALIPKPKDWGEEINISGFVFLDLASAFDPPQPLVDFLNAGEPPIYIGFGSIVVDNPKSFTKIIFDAVGKAGVRALVSRGWGGLGLDKDQVPDNIFMLDNTPHDWLFPKIKACVHHGGADQYFWGSMVGKSGAGPKPIPYKRLNYENFAEGIGYLLTEEAKSAAEEIAESIRADGDGAKNTMESFQRQLKMYGPPTLSCSIIKSDVAVWKVKGTHIRLSTLAAAMLVDGGHLSWNKLRLLRHSEWSDFGGPGEPITAIAESLKNSVRDVFQGIASAPYRLGRTTKQRLRQRSRKKSKEGNATKPLPNASNEMSGSAATSCTGNPRTRRQSLIPVSHVQYGRDISSSLIETGSALAKAPTLFIVALAQGCHNAPRLYGDDTVRRLHRVTGFHSGLVASRREFVYSIFDGVTGVVTLPIRGTRNEGAVGLLKGMGMGLGGLVLKPLSAIVGPVGYTMQGIMKQIQRRNSPQKFVRLARIAEGQRGVSELHGTEAEMVRRQIVAGWEVLQELHQAVADTDRWAYLTGKASKVEFLFINVDRAKVYLDALKSGKSVDDVMAMYEAWNIKPQDPAMKKTNSSGTRC